MKALYGTNEINQIAFVVRDIEQAAESFAKLLGIPKPDCFLTGASDISRVIYNGKRSEARNKLIFIHTPGVQIELIEPDEAPSTMRDFLDERGEGIHHIALEVDRIKRQVELSGDRGYPVVQTGEFTSSKGRYAYVDTFGRCKTMLELLEREEPQAVTAAAEGEREGREPLLGTGVVKQIAFVVRDLEATIDAYCELLGAEKPRIIEAGAPEVTQVVFRGEPTDGKSRYAFIDTPLVQIELIEPDPASPSTWLEHLERHGEGVHHISFVVHNLDEKAAMLENMGFPVIQKGNFWNGRGKYAYMDTVSEWKVIIELLEKYDG
ncbi:hypothetical protein SD70_22295 [Gordoniibacillus kamchatkensis]|uniref:VOC domain-containing protein n=1 Tax=Gordoniibacillus kamchatkensis TaxID=1590651 RepID=A0ABR5ADH1_9BACL|nr:VOC family protein [Paenibacillus sp. VKM B-2647]KIL39062.1 hypothetical protein SD70_22295 [Paenibacillus sp. VKM B-2647]